MNKIRLVVDRETRMIGCVLIQAALGGDSSFVAEHVPSELWNLTPSNPAMVEGSKEQWLGHIARLEKAHVQSAHD